MLQGRPIYPYRSDIVTTAHPEKQRGTFPSFLSIDEVINAEAHLSQEPRLPGLRAAFSGLGPPPFSHVAERINRPLRAAHRAREKAQRQRRAARIQELLSMPAAQMTNAHVTEMQQQVGWGAASSSSTRPFLAAASRPLAPAPAMPLAEAANPSGVTKATRGRGARGRARGSAATQNPAVGASTSARAAVAPTTSGSGEASERGRARGRGRGRSRGRPGRGM